MSRWDGVVSLPVLDLRRAPSHRAELVSQLLLGECVEVLAAVSRGEWLRVRSREDRYAGWVRAWGITRTDPARWSARARHRIAGTWLTGTSRPDGGPAVTTLLWRNRVELVARRGDRDCLELPDGRRCWVPVDQVAPEGARPILAATAARLLGIPYLWGGRSVQGFDCSGLVQQLLASRGLSLPRDAHDQWKSSRPLAGVRALRAGDLLFFGRPGRTVTHVGLALGGGRFIHAMGWVRLAHVHARNPLYDKQLMKWLRACGRPVSRGWGFPGTGPDKEVDKTP
jgi:hypothetical protein